MCSGAENSGASEAGLWAKMKNDSCSKKYLKSYHMEEELESVLISLKGRDRTKVYKLQGGRFLFNRGSNLLTQRSCLRMGWAAW